MSSSGLATAMVALSLEVRPLADLRYWEPVGTRLDAISGVLAGTHTLSRADVACLRRWAGRWRVLHPKLRAFYAAETAPAPGGAPMDPGIIESALWRILEGEGRPDVSSRQRAALGVRWVARYGCSPSYDLAPKPDR